MVLLLVLAVVLLWSRLSGPRTVSCRVFMLHDRLHAALLRLMSEGCGYVIVDAGLSFIQFCPRPDGGLLVDVPTQKTVCTFEMYDAMEKLGFQREKLYDTVSLEELPPVFYAYQKVTKTALEATLTALEVIYQIFDRSDEEFVLLVTDYKKPKAST